jgi:hypothetical protein
MLSPVFICNAILVLSITFLKRGLSFLDDDLLAGVVVIVAVVKVNSRIRKMSREKLKFMLMIGLMAIRTAFFS